MQESEVRAIFIITEIQAHIDNVYWLILRGCAVGNLGGEGGGVRQKTEQVKQVKQGGGRRGKEGEGGGEACVVTHGEDVVVRVFLLNGGEIWCRGGR